MEETATSYMPNNIDVEAWLPEADGQRNEVDEKEARLPPWESIGEISRFRSQPPRRSAIRPKGIAFLFISMTTF
ncbi:hypothetical protein A6U92_16725 [Agrobacterium rubi]|nr:hypothetical protein A6U92_16725 [Agrobacterium rubi]